MEERRSKVEEELKLKRSAEEAKVEKTREEKQSKEAEGGQKELEGKHTTSQPQEEQKVNGTKKHQQQ